jgi:hypothetical protein
LCRGKALIGRRGFFCLGASWPVGIETNMNDNYHSLKNHPKSGSKLAYSVDEFCHLTSLGRTKVFEEIRHGRLQVKKVGRRTIIPVESALKFLNEIEG